MHDLVESDNVNVTMLIGPGFTGQGELSRRRRSDEVDEWELIEATVSLTRRSTPDYIDMRLTPSEGTEFPSNPARPTTEGGLLGAEFTLDVDTELRADTPGPEVTRLFTGRIANMTALGDFSYEAIAYDPTQQPFLSTTEGGTNTSFMNSTIDLTPPGQRIVKETLPGWYAETSAPGSRKITVKKLLNIVLDEAGIPEEKRRIDLQTQGKTIQTPPELPNLTRNYNIEVWFSNWEVPVHKVLTRITQAANADWWFDRFGNFHFGTPVADKDIFAYELKYITDASDGKTSPPYQSVRVIGNGVSSAEGWSRGSMIKDIPTALPLNADIKARNTGLKKPTFVYRNMELNTQKEVENVAKKLTSKLQSQSATGTVSVVGFPELRPLDVIQMPNTDRQPMGGERYGVGAVTHSLNSSDGFTTKIEVTGLVGGQLAFEFEETEELDARPAWAGSGSGRPPTITLQ